MYAFQWYTASFISNRKDYLLKLETYAEAHESVSCLSLDATSNKDILIFNVDFLYARKTYDIIAEITPSLQSIIDITIRVMEEEDADEDLILVISHEAEVVLRNILMNKYEYKDFEKYESLKD